MFNMPFQLSHPSIIQSPDDADSAVLSEVEVKVRGSALQGQGQGVWYMTVVGPPAQRASGGHDRGG